MNLLEKIQRQFKQSRMLSLSELQKELESLTVTLNEVSPFISAPDSLPYGRNVIFRSDFLEVLVLCFPTQSKTAIHNHGQSIGCGKVICGELTEFSYRLNKEGVLGKLSKTKVGEKNSFLIPEQHIHSMANNSEEELVTLHIYSPPLSDVQYFTNLSAAGQGK